MTREEAVLLVTNCTINSYDYSNLKFAVNKIYDDFENRSCKSCKYVKENDICTRTYFGFYGEGICGNIRIYEKDFCCNKYETKDK